MARPCSVCIHDSRAAIETAILAAKPATQIAKNFGLTYTTKAGTPDEKEVPDHRLITRHRDNHMRPAYDQAMADREATTGKAFSTRLQALDDAVDEVIRLAKEGRPLVVADVPLLNEDGSPIMVRDNRLVLSAVREARANLELAAKLAGRTDNEAVNLDPVKALMATPEGRALLAKMDQLAADLDDAPASGP